MTVARNSTPIEPASPDLISIPPGFQHRDTEQVRRWLLSKGVKAPDAQMFVSLYSEIGISLGVNWLWALCQACRETGFWHFGGDVQANQHNYAGLGATGNGNPGESFPTPVHGVIAHLHHLMLYAGLPVSKEKLFSNRDYEIYDVLLGRAGGARFADLTGSWAADSEYYQGIRSLVIEAENYQVESDDALEPKPTPQPAPSSEVSKPRVDIWKTSPNQSDRGATISKIVLHNTAGSFAGAVSWLCNPQARASAHLVVARDGRTAQIVGFDGKAWHAGNGRINANSIGIEIEATESQRGMTHAQEQKVIAWVWWLMNKYGIEAEDIGIHRWYRNTSCPALIWPTDDEFSSWRKRHFKA